MSEFSVGFCWENLLLLPNLLRFLCWFSLQPILSSFVFQTLETLGSNIFEGELVDVIVTSNQCRSDKGIKHYVLRNTQVTALPSGTSPDIWPRASQACREAHGAIERQLRLDVCQIGSCIFSLCMAELHRSQSFWSIPSISACKTGWWYTYPSEKYESVSWDDYSQYMEKSNSCSKPPTRIYIYRQFPGVYIFSIYGRMKKCYKPPTRKWGNSWLVARSNTCATCRDSPVERTPNSVPWYQTVTFCGIISNCSFLRGYSDSPVCPTIHQGFRILTDHSPRSSNFSSVESSWIIEIPRFFHRKNWKLPHLQNAKFQGHVCEVRGLHSGLDEVAANCGWTTLL